MYRYPDKDDVLTCQLIDEEFDGRYWGESEKLIINEINDQLLKVDKPVRMLDVGCGRDSSANLRLTLSLQMQLNLMNLPGHALTSVL